MDAMQKNGLKAVAGGIVGITVGCCFSLLPDSLNLKGVLISLLLTFVSVYIILAGAALLYFGDKAETLLGALGSVERRAKVNRLMAIGVGPALLASGLLYFLITQRGFHFF